MVRNAFLILLVLCVSACSMASRKEQASIRDLFSKGQYQEALWLLEESEFKKNKENRLLYLLQKGRILRAIGENTQAATAFVEASDLMDKLYTKSIKEELLTSFTNENYETFYGSPYERSMLFYYQALSFLDVYQRGYILEKEKLKEKDKEGKDVERTVYVEKQLNAQERRRYLFRARASIVAWDTFYKELRRNSGNKSVFDEDLFAKIAGAKIHELINKRADDQIALQLYKDAFEILNRKGLAFKAYNENFEAFAKDLKGEDVAKSLTVKKTDVAKELEQYLKVKILKLTYKRRPYESKKIEKKLSATQEIKQQAKKKTNVTILIEKGLVSPLIGEDFSYNLASAMDNVEDPVTREFIKGVGLPVLTYFAMGPLGLGSVSRTRNSRLYVRHGVGEALTAQAGIEFEMAVIKEPEVAKVMNLYFYKKEVGGKETLIQKNGAALVGPVSDMAYQMNLERASNAFSERGLRIALKHIVAIIAAYKTYQSMKESSGEVFARPAAFAQYVITAKGIKESERADTRQWSSLPGNIYISELYLDKGDYVVKLGNEKSQTKIGDFSVSGSSDFFSYNLQ